MDRIIHFLRSLGLLEMTAIGSLVISLASEAISYQLREKPRRIELETIQGQLTETQRQLTQVMNRLELERRLSRINELMYRADREIGRGKHQQAASICKQIRELDPAAWEMCKMTLCRHHPRVGPKVLAMVEEAGEGAGPG